MFTSRVINKNTMFSSQEYLDNKTGRDDLNRFQYLQALVTEFQDTSSDGIYNYISLMWFG